MIIHSRLTEIRDDTLKFKRLHLVEEKVLNQIFNMDKRIIDLLKSLKIPNEI